MKPEAFNECFTIGLSPAGEPVQRPMRGMTADEFLAAWAWHREAAARLEEEGAAVLDLLSDKAEEGRLSPAERRAYQMGANLMHAAGVEHGKAGRLMQLACLVMPQWVRQPQVSVADAVRLWWPDSRDTWSDSVI
jgi:hypothetical protein